MQQGFKLTQFLKSLEGKQTLCVWNLDLHWHYFVSESYKEFHRWSCDSYDKFWEEVWHFTEIVHSQAYDQVN